MYSRKLALALAKRYRTCPPPDVQKDVSFFEEMKQHLAICPYCSGREPSGISAWQELTERLQKMLSPRPARVTGKKPAVGQIRLIRPDLGTWREGYFYNPPLVLILDLLSDPAGALKVAQVYHDIALAGPGDLILTKGPTLTGELFIESWNTYTLNGTYFGRLFGEFSEDVVEAVKKLKEDPGSYPPWAVRPRPLQDQDVRIYFRQLEVEVGYTFASRAAEEFLTEIERPSLKLVYSSPDQVRRAMRRVEKGIRWPFELKSVEEALALAHFPPEALPLAAEERPRKSFVAKLLFTKGGEISEVKPVTGEVFRENPVVEGWAMSGRIYGMPEGSSGSQIFLFFEVRGERPLPASDWEWDEETGDFYAVFETKPAGERNLEVAVVFESGGDSHA